MLDVESIRFSGTDEFATLSDESDTTFEYTVAWIDCLHTTTRGIFTRANHLDAAATRETAAPRRQHLSMPFTPPVSLVNRPSLKLFNELYFAARFETAGDSSWIPFIRWMRSRIGTGSVRGFRRINAWFRRRSAAMATALSTIARHRAGSFLAVLKPLWRYCGKGFSFPGRVDAGAASR